MSEPAIPLEPEEAPEHVLYRMYNRSRRLLYVGITIDVGARFAAHAVSKGWWTEVATIKIERFADRASVAAAEVQAIKEERPRYNIVHRYRAPKPVRPVGRPATGETFIARIRIPIDRWRRFDRAAKALGSDRAKVMNQFVAWFLREPGAQLPARPDFPVESLPGDDDPIGKTTS